MGSISPISPKLTSPDEQIREKHDSQQVLIQFVLLFTFLIFTMILYLGRHRSQGNSNMKLVATYSFILTAPIISFIPGLMSAPGKTNDLYAFWIAFIAYLASVANQTSCYTLGDNEDRKKRLIVDYSVAWPLIFGLFYKSLATPEIIVPIVLVFWLVFLKLRERSHALSYATNSSSGLSRASKIISYFAKYQKESGGESRNASYSNLLVGVKETRIMVAKQSSEGLKLMDLDLSKSITLDMVLDSNNEFLEKTDEGNELQNTCISFGMFWVLLAKMVGYDNVDTKVFKVGNKHPNDSFDLVEKELSFLYEYLFTNYYAIYDRGLLKKSRDVCVILLFLWLTLPLFIEYRSEEQNLVYVLLKGHVVDTGFTRFVILAIIVMELVQIGYFMTSKWAKVMYTCSYLRNPSSNFIRNIIWIAFHVPRPRRRSFFCLGTFTRLRISQYSILKSFGAIPLMMWAEGWIGSYIDLPKIGHAGSTSIDLSTDLKRSLTEAIDTCLEDDQRAGKFSNGIYSLEVHNVEEEIIRTYVRNVTNQARVTLIWHIATSYLEDIETKRSQNLEGDIGFEAATTTTATTTTTTLTRTPLGFETATIISKYSAYLVGFFPEIFSVKVYTTKCEFDEAVKELIIEQLKEPNDSEDPKGGLHGDNSILDEARKLKGKLERLPNLWEILAQFWTERLLFLALSDHNEAIEAHANSLCVGGEFITHLWALVTHAGCSRASI